MDCWVRISFRITQIKIAKNLTTDPLQPLGRYGLLNGKASKNEAEKQAVPIDLTSATTATKKGQAQLGEIKNLLNEIGSSDNLLDKIRQISELQWDIPKMEKTIQPTVPNAVPKVINSQHSEVDVFVDNLSGSQPNVYQILFQ